MRKRGKKGLSKKGLSPIIATVLLILIVVVLAVIIYLWAKGFVKEKNIKLRVKALNGLMRQWIGELHVTKLMKWL